MAPAKPSDERRALPAVGLLLQQAEKAGMLAKAPRAMVAHAVRNVVGRARTGGANTTVSKDWLAEVDREVDRLTTPSLRRVINATGVILHTNLGRAPLPAELFSELASALSGYANLEYDLEKGERGSRHVHCAELLCAVTGAEAALLVNNNAAAVLLALRAMAKGREVIISRGELVEIGGSFRIPDIMEASGARLKEVGTTNRTRLSDYEQAISGKTGLLLKVHPSNFRMEGFVEEVSLNDLVRMGTKHGVPVAMDLGSGSLVPLPGVRRSEPPVGEVLRSGVDLLTFSGDKMLGGPQAGIILGRKTHVERMRKDPWLRVLRCDKVTLALMERTLRNLEKGNDGSVVLRLLSRNGDELRAMAEEIKDRVTMKRKGWTFGVVDTEATLGGGSLPQEALASVAVSIRGPETDLQRLERQLRRGAVPVVARRREAELLLDIRTVLPEDLELLVTSCRAAMEGLGMG